MEKEAVGLKSLYQGVSSKAPPYQYSTGVTYSTGLASTQMNNTIPESKKKKGISFKDTGQNVVQGASRFEALLSQSKWQNEVQVPSTYSSKKAKKGILKNRNSKQIAENIDFEKLRAIREEELRNEAEGGLGNVNKPPSVTQETSSSALSNNNLTKNGSSFFDDSSQFTKDYNSNIALLSRRESLKNEFDFSAKDFESNQEDGDGAKGGFKFSSFQPKKIPIKPLYNPI